MPVAARRGRNTNPTILRDLPAPIKVGVVERVNRPGDYPRKSRQSSSHIMADRRRLSVSTRSLCPWNMIGYSV